jgi:hypothetical protein
MILLPREVTMAPYSMDLRERVVRAWDTSGDAEGSPRRSVSAAASAGSILLT